MKGSDGKYPPSQTPPMYTQNQFSNERESEALSKIWFDILFANLLFKIISKYSC